MKRDLFYALMVLAGLSGCLWPVFPLEPDPVPGEDVPDAGACAPFACADAVSCMSGRLRTTPGCEADAACVNREGAACARGIETPDGRMYFYGLVHGVIALCGHVMPPGLSDGYAVVTPDQVECVDRVFNLPSGQGGVAGEAYLCGSDR